MLGPQDEGVNDKSPRFETLMLKMRIPELVDSVPGVVEDVLSREVMEFARIHHERNQIAFSVFHQFVDQFHGVEIRNVDIRSAMENEKWDLQSVHMRDG